jgi:hypothetical protein
LECNEKSKNKKKDKQLMTHICCAMIFVTSLNKMDEGEWKALFDGAQEHLPDKKRGHGSSASTNVTLVDDSENHIQDPLADFVMSL